MKIFNLVVVYLMVHNHMSHNQAKKWVLSWIYRVATDFEKSKKKMMPPGPGGFGIIKKKFFKETDTSPVEHIKSIFDLFFGSFQTYISGIFCAIYLYLE